VAGNDLEQEEALIEAIKGMSHEQLCRAWRFSPSGTKILQGKAGDYFKERLFKELGGFTPEISKKIGWDYTAPEQE
jgi:hypothetical protein